MNLVSNELVATIEHAANKLEQFAATPDNGDLLQSSIDAIEQIRGTLNLVQLYGADLLAEEILCLAKTIEPQTGQDLSGTLGKITGAFFILPRYLEYTQQTRRGMPVLLIPYINELRQEAKKPPLPESHFFTPPLKANYKPKSAGSALDAEGMSALIRRLRHMFQVGLLNAIQGKQVPSALGIMERALERLEIIAGGRAMAQLWWLGAATLEAMRTNNLEISKARKLCLTLLDRQIKVLQDKGLLALEAQPPAALMKQLLFIVALAHKPGAKAQQVLSAFALPPLGYSDSDLRNEREALKGPSINTVASVMAVLKDELRSIKEILENSSQASDGGLGEYGELSAHMVKLADILSVVGLTSASSTLKEEAANIDTWQEANRPADKQELVELADALLYVESTVTGLDSLNLTDEKLLKANSLARQEVIASSQLAEAEMVVIKEAESGLALTKRALSSFADSNYDHGHIKNVGATLNTVRGGMTILNLQRAAAVINSCVEFIEDTLLVNDQPVAIQQLLETFADAIIGLEYYLDAVKTDRSADDAVLAIAEESLQALGHRVIPV
nr:pilus assembly protein [Aestuariicella hydrocarbonica]